MPLYRHLSTGCACVSYGFMCKCGRNFIHTVMISWFLIVHGFSKWIAVNDHRLQADCSSCSPRNYASEELWRRYSQEALRAKATSTKMFSFWSPARSIFLKIYIIIITYGKMGCIYSTASCSCHGSEKMLVNAVVKMQWVAPHRFAQPDSRVQRRVWPTAYLAALNIEALQMHFLYLMGWLYVGKVKTDRHSCVLLAFQGLVYWYFWEIWAGFVEQHAGAIGKFRCPLTTW